MPDHVRDFCIIAIEKDSQNLCALRILLTNLQQRNAENTSCNTLLALVFFLCCTLCVVYYIFCVVYICPVNETV